MGAGAGWRHRRGGILVLGPRPAALPALPELGAPGGPGLVPLPSLWPPVSPERPAAALTRVPGTGGAAMEPSRNGSCERGPRGRATPARILPAAAPGARGAGRSALVLRRRAQGREERRARHPPPRDLDQHTGLERGRAAPERAPPRRGRARPAPHAAPR